MSADPADAEGDGGTDLCLAEVDHHGVALLTFNRPHRLNGMTGEMEIAFYLRLLDAYADPAVRAIVVTGSGRGFCVGADLDGAGSATAEPLPNTKIPTTTLLDIDKPVIAAINGPCAGMGFALALMCDYRLIVPDARCSTSFARRGLIAEYGIAWHLSQIAGRAVALDLLLSARTVTGAELVELGVVHRAVEPERLLDEAMAIARELGEKSSPASMATIKRQVLAAPNQSAHEAMAEADELMRQSLLGPDVAEGVGAFLHKRPTAFKPLGAGTRFNWMDESPAGD